MSTTSDILTTPLSGLNYIDALLDTGPDWNFATNTPANTITYTFSTASGNETFASHTPGYNGLASSFSSAQQTGARAALAYVSAVTGIKFVETSTGTAAQLHFANADLNGSTSTSGLCSWSSPYSYDPNTNALLSYKPNVYIYLDNAEFSRPNGQIVAGSSAYETLLHELGHSLGLKHPFDDAINLPYNEDNTQNTLMSYYSVGGPHAVYSQYDIAALNWLYGTDGLGGALGIGSSTGARYLTGTSGDEVLTGTTANDVLRGNGGSDVLDGGAGIDTAIFSGKLSAYTISSQADGSLLLSGADGSDLLSSIEILQFSDGSYNSAQVLDITAPAAPTANVTLNAAGYISGAKPLFVGTAEANATITVYNGTTQIGTATADAKGLWAATTTALADGSYSVSITATDAAGNVSAPGKLLSFKVDTHAPVSPAGAVQLGAGGNQPVFSGTGEAGSTINLMNTANGASTLIAHTTADAGGTWSVTADPVVNGSYSLTVQSVDAADNATNAPAALAMTIASSLNRVGTAGADLLTGSAGNNAIDGGAGIDTVLYSGARSGFTVAKSLNGYSVVGAGTDTLVNVERISFDNGAVALDIDGHGGQAYRLYAAAFDRTPDLVGAGFWINGLDNGVALEKIAGEFITSNEFVTKYGANQSNTQFLTTLYNHVMHRQPDDSGFAFWLGALDTGVSRAHVLKEFSESPENMAQVIGAIQNGVEYTLWHG